MRLNTGFAIRKFQSIFKRMNKEQIGENAGIVWRALHNDKCSWEELVTVTELNPLELAAAIGWLTREDKIRFLPERGIMCFDVYHECYY